MRTWCCRLQSYMMQWKLLRTAPWQKSSADDGLSLGSCKKLTWQLLPQNTASWISSWQRMTSLTEEISFEMPSPRRVIPTSRYANFLMIAMMGQEICCWIYDMELAAAPLSVSVAAGSAQSA